jgi:hypothetical protein
MGFPREIEKIYEEECNPEILHLKCNKMAYNIKPLALDPNTEPTQVPAHPRIQNCKGREGSLKRDTQLPLTPIAGKFKRNGSPDEYFLSKAYKIKLEYFLFLRKPCSKEKQIISFYLLL